MFLFGEPGHAHLSKQAQRPCQSQDARHVARYRQLIDHLIHDTAAKDKDSGPKRRVDLVARKNQIINTHLFHADGCVRRPLRGIHGDPVAGTMGHGCDGLDIIDRPKKIRGPGNSKDIIFSIQMSL